MARPRPAPEGWGAFGFWLRCSLVPDRCGYAPRSRLARSQNRRQQNPNLFLSGPLAGQRRPSRLKGRHQTRDGSWPQLRPSNWLTIYSPDRRDGMSSEAIPVGHKELSGRVIHAAIDAPYRRRETPGPSGQDSQDLQDGKGVAACYPVHPVHPVTNLEPFTENPKNQK